MSSSYDYSTYLCSQQNLLFIVSAFVMAYIGLGLFSEYFKLQASYSVFTHERKSHRRAIRQAIRNSLSHHGNAAPLSRESDLQMRRETPSQLVLVMRNFAPFLKWIHRLVSSHIVSFVSDLQTAVWNTVDELPFECLLIRKPPSNTKYDGTVVKMSQHESDQMKIYFAGYIPNWKEIQRCYLILNLKEESFYRKVRFICLNSN